MCPSCSKIWTALQVLWSTVYVICGAGQLIAGIFFIISTPTLHLSCNIWTGSWNIIVGIVGGILSCLVALSSRRQECLLYMAVSILAVNSVNVILTEWGLYFTLNLPQNHLFIDYASFATRIATAVVILVAFFDSQFAFCAMQIGQGPDNQVEKKRKYDDVLEQVSDIEYIIPRTKPAKSPAVFDAYSQSWVFDSEAAPKASSDSPYVKILENGATPVPPPSSTPPPPENPLVHVEEASDDSTSTSDRKLYHMRSFSRSTSPVLISSPTSSSHIDLKQPIYDSLRLTNDSCNYQKLPIVSPHGEKVQYASLMKELQRVIVKKKEPSSSSENSSSTLSNNTNNSDDVEFSKELEAALQLIQDLESPNTPSEPTTVNFNNNKDGRQVSSSSWQLDCHNNSDSEKTLSATSLSVNGKVIINRGPLDSQSTSGYSSPSNLPSWSTTSSLNGSDAKSLAYSIHSDDNKTMTVISLYSTVKNKSVTLVNVNQTTTTAATPSVNVKSAGWKSLLKTKKKPKLCPELEGAIIKSESLAYLSDVELLARHERNKEIQREIEERVIQQLGTIESNC